MFRACWVCFVAASCVRLGSVVRLSAILARWNMSFLQNVDSTSLLPLGEGQRDASPHPNPLPEGEGTKNRPPPRRIMHPSRLLLCLTACLCMSSAVRADDPIEEVLAGTPDPTIIEARDGSGYYIFSTGRGVPIWRSRNLLDWTKTGRVFKTAVPPWAAKAVPGTRGVWAPDISRFAGKYHLYYSISTFGSQRSAIGLATNKTLNPDDPDYLWEDQGLVLDSAPGKCDFNAIDPALFVDHDGTPYLFWGSYWTGLKATPIDPTTGKPAHNRPKITPVAVRAPGVNPPSIEAPFVIAHDGYYYLFVSWDFCCAGMQSTYKIVVGRSRSVLGPYVDRDGKKLLQGHGTVILSTTPRWRGPGHNSVLQTADGDYLVHACYDARNPKAQRVLNVRRMTWKDGWPVAGEPINVGD